MLFFQAVWCFLRTPQHEMASKQKCQEMPSEAGDWVSGWLPWLGLRPLLSFIASQFLHVSPSIVKNKKSKHWVETCRNNACTIQGFPLYTSLFRLAGHVKQNPEGHGMTRLYNSETKQIPSKQIPKKCRSQPTSLDLGNQLETNNKKL